MNRDDLFSICFVDDTYGWASGRWGTILHTQDGGKTWIEQRSNVTTTLGGIYFVDRKNGWAVGNAGTIIHTADGGQTWEKQESPVPYYHMDVYFTSLLKGWIVSERTHILFTQDGGKNWEVQFSDEDYILKAISFSDSLHGWVVGEYGHIYRTDDGGNHWDKLAGGAYIDEMTGLLKGDLFLYDVAAVDGQTAWAAGIEGLVITTNDGGKTWTEIEAGAPITQLYSITLNKKGVIIASGKGVCVISEDFGRSWHPADFKPHIAYTWLYCLAVVNDSTFVACGEEGQIYMGNSDNFVKVR